MKWYALIFIAIIIETITELFKNWFPKLEAKEWIIRVVTILLGICCCFAYEADIFVSLGLKAVPFLGTFITGILCAGGSNIIFDLIHRLQENKEAE